MANSVNKVILIGRAGKDPDLKTLESGVKMARFSLATTETFKSKDGTKTEHTEWHQIVAWRSLASLTEIIVEKGSLIYIEGRIRSRSWLDAETNEKKYSFEIVADELHLLNKSQKGNQSNEENNSKDAPF